MFHLKQKNNGNSITDSREVQLRDRIRWLENPKNHNRFEHFDVKNDAELNRLHEELNREI